MEQVFDGLKGFVAHVLGLEGTALLVVLVILSMICKVIARVIPEDATGWRGVLRVISGVVGLQVENRLTMGVTVADVARELIKNKRENAERANPEVAEAVDDRIMDTVETVALVDEPGPPLELSERVIVPAFPGRLRSGIDEAEPDNLGSRGAAERLRGESGSAGGDQEVGDRGSGPEGILPGDRGEPEHPA